MRCLLWLTCIGALAALAVAGCGGGKETGAANQPTATQSSGLGKVAYDLDGEIYVKTLPDGEPQRLTDGSSPHWSPSGEWLLFMVTTGEQWVMRADGSQTRPLGGYAVWAPQEDRLAYAVAGYHTMTVVAEMADGSDRREWSVPAGEPRGLSWSPDGKSIAYAEVVNDGSRRSELWVMPLDSSSGRVERPLPTLSLPPTSVPLEERTARSSIHAFIAGQTTSTLVTEMGLAGATLDVSGDGIALSATTDESGHAVISDIPVSPDGAHPTRVNVVISAPGYAPFVYLWAPLYPDNNGPILTPTLTDRPQVDDLSGPVPPIRPAPTPVPILTPIAPPPGGVELWGSAQDGIELAGWSGDSRYVLFWLDPQFANSAMNDAVPLYSVAASGGEARKLPFGLRYGELWEAAPSGEVIAMTEGGNRFTYTMKRIALVDVATGETLYLTDGDTASLQPAWSPDGRQIAFTSQPDKGMVGGDGNELTKLEADRRIWVMDSDGSDKRQLTDDPEYRDERPLWSRDGSQVLFARLDLEGRASLWLVPAAGGEPQQVVVLQDVEPDGGRSIGWDNLFDWWGGP